MPPTPSEIAREALRHLAQHRLAPTPDNFSRAYQEIATPDAKPGTHTVVTMLREIASEVGKPPRGMSREAQALEHAIDLAAWPEAKSTLLRLIGDKPAGTTTPAWGPLVRDLLAAWDATTPGCPPDRKRDMLEQVTRRSASAPEQLYTGLRGLARTWTEANTEAPSDAVSVAGSPPAAEWPSAREAAAAFVADSKRDTDAATLLCELLAQTLNYGVVERLGYSTELVRDAQGLAARARTATTVPAIADLASRLRTFWVALEIRGEDQHGIQQGLLRLLHVLVANVAELVTGEDWLAGQLKEVEAMTAKPLAQNDIAHLERSLHEIVFKQGTLKHSLDEAKETLKSMVSTFIDRLGNMADTTGEYHDRVAGYAERIHAAADLTQITDLIGTVMEDTRGVRFSLLRSRDELVEAQRKADEYQCRVKQLESELVAVSERLHEDHLTSLPNRRGLARAFASESARADRRAAPLSLAVLDIDNFKHLNDALGHQTGDLALVHLARVVRESLRPSDVIARYGGEEFVIVLGETTVDDAVKVMIRVQRELTRRFFLHNNERVLITFSAGVAQRNAGETQDDLVERADRALYRAKEAGKNRVFAA